jgi:O-antigen ligase
MKKKYLILDFLYYAIPFFILIPNNLKEVPFICLFFSSFFLFDKKRINTKLFLFFSSFFLINLFSLLYTEDLKYGLNRLGGVLPFFYIPLTFIVLSESGIKTDKFFLKKWISIYNLSSLIFLIIFSVFFYLQGISFNYNNIRTILEELPLIGIHPIHLSILSVLGILLSFYIFHENKKVNIFFIIIQITLLVLSGTRSTFIAFVAVVFLLIFMSGLRRTLKYLILLSSMLFLSILFIKNSDFKKRFTEVILPVSYSKVNINNSTSVRNAIWRCSLIEIKKSNILIGNGIGDVPTKLQECYNCKYPELDKFYNSHNQYFSIILGMGILGLFAFLLFILYFIRLALINKNKYLLVLMIFYLYMFVFENILERKYGILPFLFFTFFISHFFNKQQQNLLNERK